MRCSLKCAFAPVFLLLALHALTELFLRQVDLAQNEQLIRTSSCKRRQASVDVPQTRTADQETEESLNASRAELSRSAGLASSAGTGPCNLNPGAEYTVGVVFGGRRDRMHLLISYLDALLSDAKLNEVHIWDFSGNDQDREWMEQTALSRPKYRFIHPKFAPGGRRLELYDFYAAGLDVLAPHDGFRPLCPGAAPNSTVIVKIDDDIVFINTTAFPLFTKFVREHPEMLTVYANIVNNGVAAYYQYQHMPVLQRTLPELSSYPVRSQRPGFCGAMWQSASRALRMHGLFVEDPGAFAWEDPENNNCIEFRPPEGIGNPQLGQGQFSINFFAARWAAWRELSDLVHCVDIDSDELLISILGTRLAHRECIFTQLNVVHLTFRSQEEQHVVREALTLYQVLLEKQAVEQ